MACDLLICAIRAVTSTSATHAADGLLYDRVMANQHAVDACELALRDSFSTEELARLMLLLIDMHSDSLADSRLSLDDFVEEVMDDF